MSPRERLLSLVERAMMGGLAALLFTGVIAFGGHVRWARPLLGVLVAALVLGQLVRIALAGRWPVLKSPLGALGALGLAMAIVQLAPLPAPIARRLSPEARAWHAVGISPRLVSVDAPELEVPADPGLVRSPATLDRPGTLRWALGTLACLAVFSVTSHLADRQGRLLLLCGSVAAGLGVNTAIGLVQSTGGSPGAYGMIRPGPGPAWAPTLLDAWGGPVEVRMEPWIEGDPSWLAPRAPLYSAFGTLVGGPGAYLALAAVGLPVLLGLALHLIAPRGSQERLTVRMVEGGQGSLLLGLVGLGLGTAGLVGYLAGFWLSLPTLLALGITGAYAATGTSLGRPAAALTTLLAMALGAGVALGGLAETTESRGLRADAESGLSGVAAWPEVLRIVGDYPLLGVGLGGFAAIEPLYFGGTDRSSRAPGALGRWTAEAGMCGLAIFGIGALWVFARLPGALRAVEPADRALPAALLGGLVGLAAFSTVHRSIDLVAVALIAVALLGAANRWLAGGTDLFVEAA